LTVIFIFFVYFIKSINSNFLENNYSFNELFISYQSGFIRRGLLGEIFWKIQNFYKINPVYFFSTIYFKTLFTGQHETLIKDFLKYIDKPDYYFIDVMEHGQSLNNLFSKILTKIENILNEQDLKIIIQGDTTSSLAIALAAFHKKYKIIHLEAGLRTFDKFNPFPEEMNRCLISKLADIHLCPTTRSFNNLISEGINKNVYLVGNTIVDSYNYFQENSSPSDLIKLNILNKYTKFILCTIHRNENRDNKFIIWKQLNLLSEKYTEFKFIYIFHPSLQESKNYLNNNILVIEPVNYVDMVHLIKNCFGIISDSGGIQEEAVCANKKILICRKTTEREEVIDC
jgi:UDP-N-acetylglucosamine 2-epimerase (non-hydrolysing)